MITKQGNALLRGAMTGAKRLGKWVFKSPTPKPGLKGFGKELASDLVSPIGLPMNGLALASGMSVGSIVGGNATGIATRRLLTPLTKKISNPTLRSIADFGTQTGGDMVGAYAFNNKMPVWKREMPKTNTPANQNFAPGTHFNK